MKRNDQLGRPAREPGKDASEWLERLRSDGGSAGNGASMCHPGLLRGSNWTIWSRASPLERGLMTVLLLLMAVFSAIPLTIDLRNMPNKDYSLWYQVGIALRQGMDIYPDPATGRLFPFMYPPSAAAILGYLSVLGKHGTTLVLVLAHSVAWVGAIILSVGLAGTQGAERRHRWLLYVAPSLCIIALIHNTYLLGQPNLMLLTLLLAAFSCLRFERQAAAGVLVATAAAIKAFPILAVGYFVYRRMWRAVVASLMALVVWLLIVPLPFRTPAQAVRDVVVWSRGMVFTYNAHGIAQRPYRSFSFKNQSIMALAHRFLRDVPADGEKVLSQVVAQHFKGPPPRGMLADGSIDLAAMLTAPADSPRWDKQLNEAEPELRRAWRVNFTSLDFRAVTAITVTSMLCLSLYVALAFPPRHARTPSSDALEFALVTLLIVMFSPLSFNYAYVWLIYPLTVALHEVQKFASYGSRRRLELVWIGAILFIPSLAVVMPLYAQAYGNLFMPALLLVIGLGLKLRAIKRSNLTGAQNGIGPHKMLQWKADSRVCPQA